MQRRKLGNSGLTITSIGLGLAALGRPGYINLGHGNDLGSDRSVQAMQEHAHEVLEAAWKGGVRYFDAARSYGRAEEFLSTWLAQRGLLPESLAIASKWGYTYTANWQVAAEEHEVKDHSLAVLQRQIMESRAFLGDFLKLYQIHSATLESGVLNNAEVLDELAHLRDGGLRIGLTLSGPNQSDTLYRAMEIQRAGKPLFCCVQATWNLLETSATGALRAAHQAGMGIIIKEALANGRLTARNRDPAFARKGALLEQVARESNTTVDALALAVVAALPWVDVVLSGATTAEQLHSNLAASAVKLSPESIAPLADLAEPPEEYWRVRSQLPWN